MISGSAVEELLGAWMCVRPALQHRLVGGSGRLRCVVVVCSEEDAEAAHRAVVELTGIAQRIRLGHPGAV